MQTITCVFQPVLFSFSNSIPQHTGKVHISLGAWRRVRGQCLGIDARNPSHRLERHAVVADVVVVVAVFVGRAMTTAMGCLTGWDSAASVIENCLLRWAGRSQR